VGEDGLQQVDVVSDAELVGDGEQEGVGFGDCRVGAELLDEEFRLGDVASAEDGAGGAVDGADLVGLVAAAAEVGAVAVVYEGEDAAADGDTGDAGVAGFGPGGAEGADLRGLLDVEGLAGLVELEGSCRAWRPRWRWRLSQSPTRCGRAGRASKARDAGGRAGWRTWGAGWAWQSPCR
jgi:hypothetical protein